MRKLKIVTMLILSLGVISIQSAAVFAEDIPTKTVSKIGVDNGTETGTNLSTGNSGYKAANGFLELDANGNVIGNPADAYMKKVTIEEVNSKVTKKTYEVVTGIQNFGIPATIICFLISILFTVFGAFSKRGVGKGIFAMGVCVGCYTLIQYAPQIVAYSSNWLANKKVKEENTSSFKS